MKEYCVKCKSGNLDIKCDNPTGIFIEVYYYYCNDCGHSYKIERRVVAE